MDRSRPPGLDQGQIALVAGGLFVLSLFVNPVPVTDVLRLVWDGAAQALMAAFTSAVAALWFAWAIAWLARERQRSDEG